MIKNILLVVLLVNCKIALITSASLKTTTEAANHLEDISSSTTTTEATTEGLDINEKFDKSTTEGPLINNDSKMPNEDDIERQLVNLFVVNLDHTSTTSAPSVTEGFSSDEIESKGSSMGLGRRTNFRTRLNCRCVIHNRCARSDSCVKDTTDKE